MSQGSNLTISIPDWMASEYATLFRLMQEALKGPIGAADEEFNRLRNQLMSNHRTANVDLARQTAAILEILEKR